jgi:predicted ArsR family transcriptional regulator
MAEGEESGLFETTRGKLLLLLCRGPQTVNELTEALGLTDNAVRAQLANLQQAGLVRQVGLRPGVRKPHVDYELTPKARTLFPQAYEQALRTLVDVLHDKLPPQQAADLLREVARRMLGAWVGGLQETRPRRRLAELLEKLSGFAAGVAVEEAEGAVVVRACGCPLASVTAGHPEVCATLAEVLGDLLGAQTRAQCDRSDVPRCCFEISAPQD